MSCGVARIAGLGARPNRVIESAAKQSSCAPAGAEKCKLALAATAALFNWRACARAGLPRRFAPRNDGWGKLCTRIQCEYDAAVIFFHIMKQPAVYIVTNRRNGTLYTGVTANLPQRAYQHREGQTKGFTARYGCKTLVWYELHGGMIEAITREKQLKAGTREKKVALIESANPDWVDLYDTLI
jgi:putative endonuclease